MLPVIIGNFRCIFNTVFEYAIPVTIVAREASQSLTDFTHCNVKIGWAWVV
jgi:hypothetical protein